MNNYLTPAEIAEYTINTGVKKSTLPIAKMLMLGFLAGAFIALASEGSNIAGHTIESVGIAKLLAGVLFPAGLMFVVLCGGELFTGNCLIVMSCLNGKSKWIDFAKNLFFVYIGNLIGSVFIAFLIYKSGQLNFTLGALGGYTIKTAAYKVNLTFTQAFCSAIMCNWLVCLAVWMAYGAKDMTGKIWGIFFPIFLFILSGFEHCVANMYYITAGMMAATNPDYLKQAIDVYGVTETNLTNLNMSGFFIKNLLPVTLGNMVGGGIFVGMIYYFIYAHKGKEK
jgi:formate/nitrite transporter